MLKKISICILVIVSLTGCNSVIKNTDSVSTSTKQQTNKETGKYSSLKGVHVWLQVKDHDNRRKYCNLLSSKGMIVDCEKYKTITSNVYHNEIAITCPKVQMNISLLLVDLLKMPKTKRLNLSNKPEYKQGESCNKSTAVFVELFESNL